MWCVRSAHRGHSLPRQQYTTRGKGKKKTNCAQQQQRTGGVVEGAGDLSQALIGGRGVSGGSRVVLGRGGISLILGRGGVGLVLGRLDGGHGLVSVLVTRARTLALDSDVGLGLHALGGRVQQALCVRVCTWGDLGLVGVMAHVHVRVVHSRRVSEAKM